MDLSRHSDAIDTIFRALRDSGKALEVNTSGYRQKIGRPLPDLPLVRRYRELGGELITLGSDAHSTADLGRGIQEGMEMLREAGFRRRQGKQEQRRAAKPLEFRTTSGLRVLGGRNKRQNDKLTRSADHRDIWLHTQKIHGSHVILCTGGREVDDDTIVEAAKLAAWFSQARVGANVPVDYTPVKNVTKPAGARPGLVIYSTCRTVNVAPEEGLVKKLQLS